MDEQRINHLSDKLLTGEITPAERQELDDWYNHFDSSEQRVHSELNQQQFAAQLYQQIRTNAGMETVKRIPVYRSRYAAVAASLLLMLSIAGIYTLYNRQDKPENTIAKKAQEIKAGSNRALLTLANGKTIDLENAAEGILPTGDQSVRKTGDGTIAYNNSADTDGAYNTLSTPKGGKFSIRLPDGTLAILDASSSLRYPSAFKGAKRMVEVIGQVYFEVVHNAKQPFTVKVADQTIEDLGTHFNINAYPGGDGIKTTVEEGLVGISSNRKTIFVRPGQAALSHSGTKGITVAAADLEEVLAWKNGYFRFNDEQIENIMAQLSRWYDIEVSYSGKLPVDGFNGTISRSKNLSQVLTMLERTGIIHFKIEGRRITVLP